MFGIEDGFDIVIGNPPYIQLQNNSGKLAKLYENQNYKAFAKTGDIYCLFYERGFFATNVNPKELIDFAGVKVFESATVDTNILLFQKAQNQKQTLACVTKNMKYDDLGNLSHFIQWNTRALNLPLYALLDWGENHPACRAVECTGRRVLLNKMARFFTSFFQGILQVYSGQH